MKTKTNTIDRAWYMQGASHGALLCHASDAAGDGDGGGVAAGGDWFAGLDPTLQANPTLAGMKGKSVTDLATRLISAEGLVGVPADQIIRRPAADADDETRLAAWKGLHGEQDYDGWSISAERLGLEGVEDGMFSDDVAKSFRELSAGMKTPLTLDQMDDLARWNIKAVMEQRQSASDELGRATELGNQMNRREFGEAHDGLMAQGDSLLAKFGGTPQGDTGLNEAQSLLAHAGLDKHPVMKALFARIGQQFTEGGGVSGGDKGGFGGLGADAKTPQQLEEEISALHAKVDGMETNTEERQRYMKQLMALEKRLSDARNQ